MKLNKPLISIVVPVYNVAKYLHQCVDSLIQQTYENLEIILVNDGSTDNSSVICESYKNVDSRIVYINQKNEGVSKAREVGTKRATGEYLMYVDSDDWINKNTCLDTINFIEENKLDVAYFTYIKEYESRAIKVNSYNENKLFLDTEQIQFLQRRLIGILDEELYNPLVIDSFSAMYMKVFKTELIISSNARFVDLKEIFHHEDTLFNIDILEKAQRVGYLNKCYYHYRKINQSSISKSKKLSFFDDWQIHLDYIELFMIVNKKEQVYYEAFNNRIALECIGLFLKLNSVYSSFSEKQNALQFILNKKRYERAFSDLKIKYMPFHWKIFFLFCKFKFTSGILLLINLMNRLKSRF